MTESWFSALSRDPLELFRGISNQPFPELHCAALKVFTVGILFFFTGPFGTRLVQHVNPGRVQCMQSLPCAISVDQ